MAKSAHRLLDNDNFGEGRGDVPDKESTVKAVATRTLV